MKVALGERSRGKVQIRPWIPGTIAAELKGIQKLNSDQLPMSSIVMQTLQKTTRNEKFHEYIKPYLFNSITIYTSPDSQYYQHIFHNPNLFEPPINLYNQIKEGICIRLSLYLDESTFITCIDPFRQAFNLSNDGTASIILNYGITELVSQIFPQYQLKYHHKRPV